MDLEGRLESCVERRYLKKSAICHKILRLVELVTGLESGLRNVSCPDFLVIHELVSQQSKSFSVRSTFERMHLHSGRNQDIMLVACNCPKGHN